MFTVAAERLTLRMRRMAFEAMLRQEIGWFDRPDNSTGSLCAKLSETAKVQAATGTGLSTFAEGFFTIVITTCIAFIHPTGASWNAHPLRSLPP